MDCSEPAHTLRSNLSKTDAFGPSVVLIAQKLDVANQLKAMSYPLANLMKAI